MPRKTTKKRTSKGKAKRYTAKQRSKLLEKYDVLRKAGKTTQEASRAVGVPYITLRSWEKKTGKKTGRKSSTQTTKASVGRPRGSKTRAVSTRSSGLVLVTPQGFRIEGISPNELIRILKALN